MAKQKKTGFGTYITTLVVDSDLTATEARLFAFMQLHVDYRCFRSEAQNDLRKT